MKIIPLGIWGGYPKANSATSSFLIEEEGFHLLVDCGSGVLASLQNHIAIQELDAVVITHYHHDHIADIGSLHYAKLIQNQLTSETKTLPIYAHCKDKQYQTLTYKQHTKAQDITQTRKIGPFTIQTKETNHPVPCLAIRLASKGKSVTFTADTAWQDSLIGFAQNTDLLISEANLYEEFEGEIPGHMSGREAGLLAREANVKQLLLTHLPHFGDVNKLVREAQQHYPENVSLANVKKVYTI